MIKIITMQNVMRRILENYFCFLGNKYDDTIIKKFETLEDKKVCRSLLSWVNDGSHSINDDLYIANDVETIERYMRIFKRIFEITENIGHYNMMMDIE